MIDMLEPSCEALSMDNFYTEFGYQLKMARRSAGLTQGELASRIGISRASLTNMERGAQRVALHQVVELAAALGLEPARLIPQKTSQRSGRLVQAMREAGETEAIVAWGERALGRIDDNKGEDKSKHERS